MRQIPFDDESFDCVYEHYAMCHLSKKDTAIAIGEMYRVTRHEGFCFLGLISMDSWPKSFFGEERSPGEFWTVENDSQEQHSMFTDEEAHFLVEDWDILSKEKRVIYLRKAAEQISETEWMGLFKDMKSTYTENVWLEKYNQRMNMINYTHIYYILRKR